MTTGMPYSKTTGTAGRDVVEQCERVHEPHLLSKQERKAQSNEDVDDARENSQIIAMKADLRLLHARQGDDLEVAEAASVPTWSFTRAILTTWKPSEWACRA